MNLHNQSQGKGLHSCLIGRHTKLLLLLAGPISGPFSLDPVAISAPVNKFATRNGLRTLSHSIHSPRRLSH